MTSAIFTPHERFDYINDRYYVDDRLLTDRLRVCDLEGIDMICSKCNDRTYCTFTVDPYGFEIVGNYEMYWMCKNCYLLSCDEI